MSEHRYDPTTKACVCGETRTVRIILDDKPREIEQHSTVGSLYAFGGRDACYRLFRDTGPEYWQHVELNRSDIRPLMLQDDDQFYFVPCATPTPEVHNERAD
jgi:hypothetical protein